MHARTEKEFLEALSLFFEACRIYWLNFFIENSALFAQEIKFCFQIYDKNGMWYDPSTTEGLSKFREQENESEFGIFDMYQLYLYVFALFTELVASMSGIVETSY